MDSMDIFKKRRGTTDRGKEYEDLHIASLVLKLVLDNDIDNFYLASNIEEFGSFDDTVVEVLFRDGTTQTYAFQLKQSHRGKQLTLSSLTADKGNFSIKRYCRDSLNLHNDNVKLIVFTNLKFDGDGYQFALDESNILITQRPQEGIVSTSDDGCCFQFIHTTNNGGYEKFFENFFLYTNQTHVDDLNDSIYKTFQETFCCEKESVLEYIRFISEWSKKEGKKEKLTKKLMRNVITLNLIKPHILQWPFSQNQVSEKIKLLRDALLQFETTIFNDNNLQLVFNLWEDAKQNAVFDKHILHRYQLSHQYVNNSVELADIEASIFLWLLDKCPLILVNSDTVNKAIRFSKNKKFIVVDNDYVGENPQTFQKLSDLKKNQPLYEKVLKEFKCSLQGKEEISLGALTELSDKLTSRITTNHLLEMANACLAIAEDKDENLPSSYIPTLLSKVVVSSEILNRVDQETLILICCVDNEETLTQTFPNVTFVRVEENEHNQEHHKPKNKKKIVLFTKNECSEAQFYKLCSERYNKAHQVRFVENIGVRGFEWVRSKDGSSDLSELLLSGDYYIEESQCHKYEKENCVNVVCGKPGMGKTTLMKSLKKRSAPTTWTILLYVRNHYKHFKEKKDNLYEFEKYILEDTRKNFGNLASQILRSLMEKHRVTYLWDGLDEVDQETFGVICRIIEHLSKKKTIQWISSRDHLKKDIENTFSILSRKVIPFDDGKQKEFVRNRLECSEDHLTTLFEDIKKNIQLFSNNDVLGIPLQIFILTELFLQDKAKYARLIKDVFSVADLYHHFVEEKFKLYYKDKKKLDLDLDPLNDIISAHKVNYIKYYQEAAVKIHFEKEIKLEMKIRQEKDEVGFITRFATGGYPEFFHYSFGEYFAALYLVESKNTCSDIQNVLFEEKYNNVRFFLDLILSRSSKAHVAVLYQNKQLLQKCTDEELRRKDDGGRNPLQVACSWGTKFVTLGLKKSERGYKLDDKKSSKSVKAEDPEYLKMIDHLTDKCNPEELDCLFNFDSFSYALKSHCLVALALVLFKTKKQLSYSLEINCTILYLAARFDYPFVFDTVDQVPPLYSEKFRGSLLYVVVHNDNTNSLKKILSKMTKIVKNGENSLHKACENGNVEIVKLLMDHDIDPSTLDNYGRTALHVSCTYGNHEITRLLLKQTALLNLKDKHGRTPLHQACIKGRVEIVKMLLENNVSVELQDSAGKLPVHYACAEGHYDIVVTLADLATKATSRCGKTPLHFASENGHSQIVELLTGIETDVNKPDTKGKTPIHYACAGGHYNVVRLLNKKGANLECVEEDGKHLLHYVCQKGDYDSFKFLLDKVQHVLHLDRNGKAPIHYACAGGFLNLVTELLGIDLNVDLPDGKGSTPIDYAYQGKHYDVVKLLIDRGANLMLAGTKFFLHRVCEGGDVEVLKHVINKKVDFTIKSADGKTPVHYASLNGRLEILKLLFDHGAEIEDEDADGKTPMHYACENGHYEVVEFLLEKVQERNPKDKNGEVPLHHAYNSGVSKILELLVENGVDVEVPDRSGKMIVHRACMDRRIDVLELLIDNEADLDITDENDETPLHHACAAGDRPIVKMLLDNNVEIRKNQYNELPIDIARKNKHHVIVNLLEDLCN